MVRRDVTTRHLHLFGVNHVKGVSWRMDRMARIKIHIWLKISKRFLIRSHKNIIIIHQCLRSRPRISGGEKAYILEPKWYPVRHLQLDGIINSLFSLLVKFLRCFSHGYIPPAHSLARDTPAIASLP